ncbi:hypothetical protein HNO89_003853 [Sporosarcina luteola]|nr:hypothetical protein [Sporosarcina luteola]
MKKGLLIFLSFILVFPLFFGFFPDNSEAKSTYVKGYYRKDGTYVKGHYRNTGGSSSPSKYDYKSTTTKPSLTTTKLTIKNTVNLYKGNNLVGQEPINELVYVKGYYRKDGTFVRPHYKTSPNHFIRDNFSYLGLSTLLPLEKKYPTYKYNLNDEIASIEHYLYTSTINDELSTYQFKNLKDYAVKLNKSNSVNTTELYGWLFYNSLGYDTYFSEALVKFDQTGTLTSELYLYQILSSMGIKQLTYTQRTNLSAYAQSLSPNENINNVINLGKIFYDSLGVASEEVESQIELDLLQNFSNNLSEN